MRTTSGFQIAPDLRWIRLGLALAFSAGASPSLSKDLALEISAGQSNLPPGPLSFHADTGIPQGSLALQMAGMSDKIVVQPEGKRQIVWWNPRMKSGESITYQVVSNHPQESSRGIKVEETSPGLIRVTHDGQLFTELHCGKADAKPYLYPVIGPRRVPFVEKGRIPLVQLPDSHSPGRYEGRAHRRSIRSLYQSP